MIQPSIPLKNSFIELNARDRARALLDDQNAHELLSPFDRIESPWLERQNITPQSDDGCVVMKGQINRENAVVVAIEGAFQGGSIGEVSGAKMSEALDLARRDNEDGIRTSAVLLLETGGVRLQEANLGLAAIAEIHASILDLRRLAPVVCVIAGPTGCFGGMSIAAGLASYIVMTREGRLGMNGPEVIEQEAGIEEFDSRDRRLVWSVYGGEQRWRTGLIDALVDDDVRKIREVVERLLRQGVPEKHRSEEVDFFRKKVGALEPSSQWQAGEFPSGWFRDECQ